MKAMPKTPAMTATAMYPGAIPLFREAPEVGFVAVLGMVVTV